MVTKVICSQCKSNGVVMVAGDAGRGDAVCVPCRRKNAREKMARKIDEILKDKLVVCAICGAEESAEGREAGYLTQNFRCHNCRTEIKEMNRLTNWMTDPQNKAATPAQVHFRKCSLRRRADKIVVGTALDRRGVPVVAGDVLEERLEKTDKGVWRCAYWVVTEVKEGHGLEEKQPLVFLNRANKPFQQKVVVVGGEEFGQFSVVDGGPVASVGGGLIDNWWDRVAVHPEVWRMRDGEVTEDGGE